MSEESGIEQKAGQFPTIPDGTIPTQRSNEGSLARRIKAKMQTRREGLNVANEARGLGEISDTLDALGIALSREENATRGSAADYTAEELSTDALASRLTGHSAFRKLFPDYGSFVVMNPDGTPKHKYKNPFDVDDTAGKEPPDITFDQVRAAVETRMTALGINPKKAASLIK